MVSLKRFPIEDIVSSNSLPRFTLPNKRFGGKPLFSNDAGVDDLFPSSFVDDCDGGRYSVGELTEIETPSVFDSVSIFEAVSVES